MTILTLSLKLPSEFVKTATVGTSSDWLIIQKSGETEVSKIAATAAAVGAMATSHAANAVGAMATSHAANSITALGGTAQALGTASNGSGTVVALSNHVHPMPDAADVGALDLTGGTLSGSLSISASSGGRSINISASSGGRSVNIGTSRTSDGTSKVGFYSQSGAGESAYILRDSGANSDMSLKNNGTNGQFIFLITTLYVRNQNNSAYAALQVGAVTYDTAAARSDPRLKRGITAVTVPPATATRLKEAVIRFNFKHEAEGHPPHLGFDAAQIRDILPEIVIARPPHPKLPDEAGMADVLSFDMTGLVASLVMDVAGLTARLEAAEAQLEKALAPIGSSLAKG